MTGDGTWADGRGQDWLAESLFAKRIVQLSGPLDHGTANQVAAQLMTLDALGDDPVELRVTSDTGQTSAALALVDVIDLLGVPVHATALGRVHGPALAVLAVCDRRMLGDHTSIRLVEPDADFRGSAGQLGQQAAAHRDEWAAFCACLARATGQTADKVAADAAAGIYLTADQAVAYGLADEVARRGADIHRLPLRSVGFRPDANR